jgi:misacylated tRNA(Ala) deacylase
MSERLYYDRPDLLAFEARVVDARPGAVLLDRTAFFPGGGGQLPDRGRIAWERGSAAVTHVEPEGELLWHVLDRPEEPSGSVQATVDGEFRDAMCRLHTGLHILNALVYQRFAGSLVTGAQIGADGTGRVDFDLPGADNDVLRALEPDLNAVIRDGLEVRCFRIGMDEAAAEPGLLRSRSVAPPPSADGKVRIVEIVGLDRQACGGTHLSNTGASPPLRILKIENKGRHNRRIRISLQRS